MVDFVEIELALTGSGVGDVTPSRRVLRRNGSYAPREGLLSFGVGIERDRAFDSE